MGTLQQKKENRLTRRKLLESPEFWEEYLKTELYSVVQDYMDENNLTRKKLAEQLGVTKGYVSQVLKGDSDHRISKLVLLALATGKAPYIYFKDLESVFGDEQNGYSVYMDFAEIEQKAQKYDMIEVERVDNITQYDVIEDGTFSFFAGPIQQMDDKTEDVISCIPDEAFGIRGCGSMEATEVLEDDMGFFEGDYGSSNEEKYIVKNAA